MFVCIASTSGTGQTGGAEPTWTVTRGAKNTDNTVTWQEATGIAALNGDFSANTPKWNNAGIKGQAITLGQVITDVAGTIVLICSTAGTSGTGAEPTWNAFTNAGATTGDGTVTWTNIGAVGNFTGWQAPHARWNNAAANTWAQNGNNIFIGNNHAETQTTQMLMNGGSIALPLYSWSVDHTVSPATTSSLLSGASISTTGNTAIRMLSSGTNLYFNGVTFNSGTGANNVAPDIVSGNVNGVAVFDNCAHAVLATGATASLAISNSGGAIASKVVFNNTTVQFSAVGQGISISECNFTWKNTANAVVLGTAPTSLFNVKTNSFYGTMVCDGVDFSALGSGKTICAAPAGAGYRILLNNCKLGASVTVAATPSSRWSLVDAIHCDSAATNYLQQRYAYEGTLSTETTIVRSGGASDGSQSISHKIVTTANSLWVEPFESFPIVQWNSAVNVNRTVTVYGIVNAATVPNNDQIWMEIEYLGTPGFPLGVFASNTKANNLASGIALTADSTSNWASLATARTNGTTYSVGNTISVASNPNRIFFCTVGGSASGSLPAGYATAIDGGTVSDGAATFRAGCRFQLQVVLASPQPQFQGYLYATVKAAQASTTFWIDPLLNFS